MGIRKRPVLAMALLLISGIVSAQTVSIGTNPQGSLAYSIGSAIAKVAIEDGDVQMRVVPQGGPTVTLPLVNAGELDFSISNSVVAAFSVKGESMFHAANKDLRAVGVLVPLYSGFIVRADSDIHQLADLKGKRVASDYLKQKVVGVNARAVLNTVGMSYHDVESVPEPNGLSGLADLEAGNVDATFFSIASGRTIQADAAVGGVRILPVERSERARKKIDEISPTASVVELRPGASFPGIEKPQGVFSASFVLMVGASVPDDVVYKVTRALYRHPEKLRASAKIFKYFDPKKMSAYQGVPLHPGAMTFYKEQGIAPADH